MNLLKWPGGKAYLMPHVIDLLERELGIEKPKRWQAVVDPLCGAVPWLTLLDWQEAMIGDLAGDLITCFRGVRLDPAAVWESYKRRAVYYNRQEPQREKQEAAYYRWRKEFNGGKRGVALQAALFLLLNRAGYNGLWRVNKKDEMNVPWGKRRVLPTGEIHDAIMAYAARLRGDRITLSTTDFEDTLQAARCTYGEEERILVLIDPPYVEAYDGYTPGGFSEEDQRRLAACVEALSTAWTVVAFNADTPLVRRLYPTRRWLRIHAQDCRKRINCNAQDRKPIMDLLMFRRSR